MVSTATVPKDFPRVGRPGCEARVQRFAACDDLVDQLVRHVERRQAGEAWLPNEVFRDQMMVGVRVKAGDWGLAPAELEWVISQLEIRCQWATSL